MIHISLSFAGVNEKATWRRISIRQANPTLTLEKSSAGVKSETLITFSFRCVALSVTPARERT
jgi:hypothetical protein